MAEYINKNELNDAIAKEFKNYEGTGEQGSHPAEIKARKVVYDMPTLKIVHCKECIHEDCGMCSHIDHDWERHEADYFCADGQKK